MTHGHILFKMRIRLFQKVIDHSLVPHERLRKVIFKLTVLVQERCSRINTGMTGIGHFEFIIDKHVDILVDCFVFELLGVVLVIEILEFTHTDGHAVDNHKLRIGSRFCGKSGNCKKQCSCRKDSFHLLLQWYVIIIFNDRRRHEDARQ